MWDFQTGKENAFEINGVHLGFRPDGSLVTGHSFVLAKDNEFSKITVWAGGKPQQEVKLPAHMARMWVSPDGALAAVSWGTHLAIVDLVAGKKLRELPGDEVVAFRPDSRNVATATGSLVRIWDIQSGKLDRQIDTGLGQVAVGLDYAPDGRHLVVANGNGTVFVLRLKN